MYSESKVPSFAVLACFSNPLWCLAMSQVYLHMVRALSVIRGADAPIRERERVRTCQAFQADIAASPTSRRRLLLPVHPPHRALQSLHRRGCAIFYAMAQQANFACIALVSSNFEAISPVHLETRYSQCRFSTRRTEKRLSRHAAPTFLL